MESLRNRVLIIFVASLILTPLVHLIRKGVVKGLFPFHVPEKCNHKHYVLSHLHLQQVIANYIQDFHVIFAIQSALYNVLLRDKDV